MTNCNYTQMTNQELVEFVKNLNLHPNSAIYNINKCYPLLWDEILFRTKFIDEEINVNKTIPLSERLYCIENNLTSIPLCQNPECNNKVGWNLKAKTFLDHCCVKCSSTDPKVQNKMNQTNINNLGVQWSMQSSQVKEKSKQTCLDKYGHERACQSKAIIEKIKISCYQHNGGQGFGSTTIKEKIKNTIINKLGVDNCAKSDEILQIIRCTNNLRYGCDYPAQNSIIYQKMINTCLKNYGVVNSMQSRTVQQKARETMNKRYGVDYYAQSNEYHKKARKPYTNPKYPNMTFGSSLEFKVYDFLTENNIEFEYQPLISFDYEYGGRTWTYHPDFFVNGKVYEVKGEQFFRINESTGKEEMYCPWGRKKLGEEKWKWLCGKYEAKHQCMIKNDVIILQYEQIQNLSEIFTSQIL